MPTVLAAVIVGGEYLRIRQWWFIPSGRWTNGYPAGVAQRVLDGTARAPDQYRVLAPHLADGIAVLLGRPLPTGLVAVDVAALAGTVALLHVLCARAGARWLIVPAAFAWAFWASKLDHWDPNVASLGLVVTAAAVVLQRPGRWAAATALALGVAACGLRTDYAAGLGLVVAAAGAVRRERTLIAVGVAVLVISQAVTLALVEAFPQAHYETAVVQLGYNVTPGSLAAVTGFYGPALLPAAVLLSRRMTPPMWWLPAWFVAELAVTFVVGRPDETRIFLPFAPVLAVAAGLACFDLVRDRDPAGRRQPVPRPHRPASGTTNRAHRSHVPVSGHRPRGGARDRREQERAARSEARQPSGAGQRVTAGATRPDDLGGRYHRR